MNPFFPKRVHKTLVFLCLIILFSGCSKIKKDPKYTAAIVNGKAITRLAFDNEMARIKQRFQNKSQKNDAQLDNIRMEILDILIGGELLYQASVDKKVQISKEEIQNEMDKVSKLFPETDSFKNTFTEEDIKRKIAIEKFITQEFSDTTIISDEEGTKYYKDNLDDFTKPEQVMASHILINVPIGMTVELKAKALEKIEDIQRQLTEGADFAELAKQYSEDSTAQNGGSLGYFMRGQMVEEVEKAAFTTDPGKISDIVETDFGYHIIKVLDKKPMVIIAYEEISDKLKAYLKQQKVQKAVDSFIKDQRKSAAIEIIIAKEA